MNQLSMLGFRFSLGGNVCLLTQQQVIGCCSIEQENPKYRGTMVVANEVLWLKGTIKARNTNEYNCIAITLETYN